MTYSEQLKSPKWQRKRLEILERDKFTCVRCGDGNSQLNVHHGYYEKNLSLWEYDNETLHSLCNVCHGLTHECFYETRMLMATINPKHLPALHEILFQTFVQSNKELAMENIKFFFNLVNGLDR